MTFDVAASRTYPVSPADAFDPVLMTPLPVLMRRRYAAIPAVRATREHDGGWGQVGQTRTIELTDGGTILETLVTVEPPTHFTYRLTDFTGPMAPLATSVIGRFGLAPAGTGVRVTWSWSIDPRSPLGPLAMPAFGRMWRGYARQALEELERVLVP